MTAKRHIAIAVDIDDPHPHHLDVYKGIVHYASEHPNWVCYIDEHPGAEAEMPGHATGYEGLNLPRYDGAIGRFRHGMIDRLKRLGIPLVNTHYQAFHEDVPSVVPDPAYTGRAAAEHLIAMGMPRLAIILEGSHLFSSKVVDAFVQRADEDNIPCQVFDFIEPAYRNKKGWVEMKANLLHSFAQMQPPIGVYLFSAPLSRVLVQTAQSNGWTVPRDMAVLCARNLASIVELSPMISSLEANNRRIGYMAAQLLDKILNGNPAPTEPILIHQATLIPRESTDYRIVNDEIVEQALRYVTQNLQEKLRVEDIAYELSISSRLLQQRFAEKLGVGLSDVIRRMRLDKAKRLLTEPDRQITSIPKAVGFSSPNAMNKIFTRELGMTPSEYRKQVLDDKPYKSNAI